MSASNVMEVPLSGSFPDDEITSLPILILNVHENCNCKCGMCDIWKRPPGAELPLERVREYQSSIRSLGVRWIVLTGGEPLLHSRFADLCQMLKECDVRLTVLSTGLLLKKKAAEIAAHVDEVIVSLDGPREVHDRIRGVQRAYDLMREGIVALRTLNPSIVVQARSTIQAANFLLLRQTVSAANDLTCNSISFLAVDTTSQAFNRELVWPLPQQHRVGLTASQVNLLEHEMNLLIEECHDEIRAGFIVERPEKLRRLVAYFRQQLTEEGSSAPLCNAPWVSMVVEVDGTVRPCFFHQKVSSTQALSLESAVNAPIAKAFRRNLNVETNPICKRCVCSLNYPLQPSTR